MNRFWVRMLVFVGLMTAAGVIFGILEAAFFTRRWALLPPDAPGSNAVWAFPASMALVLFAVWFAARTARSMPGNKVVPQHRVASFILVTEMVIVASSGLLPKVILRLMVRKR